MDRSSIDDARLGSRTPSRTNNSASRPIANTSEEWTKISNVIECRRVQYRVVQRKYCEKLKRRLDDSDKIKAPSTSSENLHAEQVPPKCPPSKGRTRQQVTKSTAVAKRQKIHLLPLEKAASYDYTADIGDRDEIFTQECSPQTCVSPIPIISSPPLSPYDPRRQSPYGQSQA
ncbi:hypothetical protein N7541_009250 [Penicillium brevicompactum]|uniref:Uncharacterized protein n=1 Tax=Penicillium brevicompactum TaxID=5074 RepID=A0A9W9QLB6_PENBR|nr:hypothetical protein N7541_009250 [Penicillium brevicompactum]